MCVPTHTYMFLVITISSLKKILSFQGYLRLLGGIGILIWDEMCQV